MGEILLLFVFLIELTAEDAWSFHWWGQLHTAGLEETKDRPCAAPVNPATIHAAALQQSQQQPAPQPPPRPLQQHPKELPKKKVRTKSAPNKNSSVSVQPKVPDSIKSKNKQDNRGNCFLLCFRFFRSFCFVSVSA